MGLSITVEVGKIKRTAKLDLAEIEALEAEAQCNCALKDALAVALETPEFADSKRLRCKDFLDAVELILGEGKGELESRIYYLYGSPMPGIVPKGRGSGVNVTVGGQSYVLFGGVNECTLTRYGQDATGAWTPMSVKDVRQLKSIQSDDGSRIEIRTRAKAGSTAQFLRQIKKALGGVSPDSDVTITIS